MKKKLKYLLCLTSLSLGGGWCEAYAQNLVPNGSFEIYSTCPTGPSQTNKATPWYDPTGTIRYNIREFLSGKII